MLASQVRIGHSRRYSDSVPPEMEGTTSHSRQKLNRVQSTKVNPPPSQFWQHVCTPLGFTANWEARRNLDKSNVLNVRWVHVPKTGTSFNTILKESRITLRRGHQDHSPLVPPAAHPEWVFAILLREPNERLASGFLHDAHGCADTQETVRKLAGQSVNLQARPHSSGFPSIKCDQLNGLYVHSPNGTIVSTPDSIVLNYAQCVEGCTANMLSGKQCNDASELPRGYRRSKPHKRRVPKRTPLDRRKDLEAASAQALTVLKEHIDFIGFTSNWNQTVCRWVRFLGIEHQDLSTSVLANTRPSRSKGCNAFVQSVLQRTGWKDAIDEAVFKVARGIVETTNVEYNS